MFRGSASHHTLLLSTVALALAGCPKEEQAKTPPPQPEKNTAEVAAQKNTPKADVPTTDPECIGAWSAEGAPAQFEANGRTFELRGAKLTETSNDPDDQAVIGVIANIKEDTPENLKNITSILEFFKNEKVDMIVVNGDVGESQQQIINVLEPIAAAKLPTFVIIGNLEKKSDFAGGLAAITAKHKHVFNLGMVRLVALDDVTLVSQPGYYDKSYLHAGEAGCNYKAADLEVTKAIIKAAGDAKALVLVSHGPPRQDGSEAIDRMSPGETNVGDPELMKVVRETGVKFGVFSNIQEAGGRGTNVDGTSLVGEGKPAAELFLNPGPADAVAWKMNDRTESVGMAASLTIKGKQASFKIHRIP